MGCVFGKTVAGAPAKTVDHVSRSSDEPAATVTVNAVRVRRKSQERQKRGHTTDFPANVPATERSKPRPELSLSVPQQGWPSWLMAVAGDAIGDWTPRRASTFEKLDKVIKTLIQNYYYYYEIWVFNVFGFGFCLDWSRDV